MTEAQRAAEEDRLATLTDRQVIDIWLAGNHHEPTEAQMLALGELERRSLDVDA